MDRDGSLFVLRPENKPSARGEKVSLSASVKKVPEKKIQEKPLRLQKEHKTIYFNFIGVHFTFEIQNKD